MADEIRYTCVASYSDSDGLSLPNLGVVDQEVDSSAKQYVAGSPSVGTTEEAIPLGEVTPAGAMMIVKNLDDTNYIEIRTATGASNDAWKVPAGECHIFRFGSDITAPYWIANTAAVKVDYRLIEA